MKSKDKTSSTELIKYFWEAPKEAFFNEKVIASVLGCSVKTLQNGRWNKYGPPYRKIFGVVYIKSEVISWIEKQKIIEPISKSEYMKRWHLKNKKKVKSYAKKKIREITAGYAKELLRSEGFKNEEISPGLVGVKRAVLKLKRKISKTKGAK